MTNQPSSQPGAARRRPPLVTRRSSRQRAERQLRVGASLLGMSVLADSGLEHYRGSFRNRAMFAPLVASTLEIAVDLLGSRATAGREDAAPCAALRAAFARDTVHYLSAATGLVGLAFHAYNVGKRPGGLSWLNLFYAAPLGAPAALVLAGLLGRGAENLRDDRSDPLAGALGVSTGQALAGVAAAGLAGTVAEAGLLHFRGAFQNPAMVLPVALPPVAAALLGATAIAPARAAGRTGRWTRRWLKLTALLGLAGVGFHAYGVSRSMGGWRNWSQNVLNGPPLPAPPSFTGLAVAGLAALSLLESERGEAAHD